jgi:outer membrane protein OmpA-like peptidoglycan-associated protein
MRAQARRIKHDEEEESAFVSMTDMTVGFLFIMMILLAFFASQILEPDAVSKEVHDAVITERDYWKDIAETQADVIADLEDLSEELQAQLVAMMNRIIVFQQQIIEKDLEIARLNAELELLKQIDPLEEYLSRVASVRRDVLLQLRDAIRRDFPDLQVELSEQSDALRFQGEGLFASGSSNLTPRRRDIVASLARRLDEVLPCFTIGELSQFSQECNPDFVMIESVQIEGHTDDVGTDVLNRTLSTRRANTTFFAMTDAAPTVMSHRNLKFQPVLSVAAYGPDRPVSTNETLEGRATNRRIDLRFIMVTPPDTEGIETIRAALDALNGIAE